MKKNVLIFMFIWIIFPFILINDFYPFFRFGMFAEPIKSNIQTELFSIEIETDLHKKIIKSEEVYLSEQHFQYLIRYAFYQNKLKKLAQTLENIIQKSKNQKIKNIFLIHKIYNQNKKLVKSTTIPLKF
ncbi:MAG: hypothetical protein EAZ85_04920 [Bacteroidetes bacterium]|nr:MAG: hypothetical protein EAZ85_04920 [Bacteroidota bacterium]TAG88943.1 MAG: hypothetical protein EAZ20_07555 [Bacteroidota bacterium]